MASLDPRSLIAMGGLMAIVMAVVLFFLRRHYPPHIRGVGHWAAVPVLWLVASVLYGGRDTMPALLSVVLANALLMLSGVIYYQGCRRFFGHASSWRAWVLMLACSILGFAWLTLGQPSYHLRLMWLTAAMIVIYAATLVFLLRYGGRRLPARMAQAVLALQICVLLVRLVSAAYDTAEPGLLAPSTLQTLYVGAYVFTVLMLSIAAVLMAADRLVTELERLATHDSLTQAFNRHALLQQCEEELARSRRSGRGPALLMLDLDHFKLVNDAHGHQRGDAVLVHFAATIKALLRRQDKLGRYGGEEFTVLLPETGLDDAHTVAERIHTALASGHALDSRVSIGLTTWLGPQDTVDAMLARADHALYQAKEQGRDRTCAA